MRLVEELKECGMSENRIQIEFTDNKKEYGSLVYLDITYYYRLKLKKLIDGKINLKNEETKISVKKSSFSKVY